jgi:hypothetical protein
MEWSKTRVAFVEMMVMDGCFLLELARTAISQIDEDILID